MTFKSASTWPNCPRAKRVRLRLAPGTHLARLVVMDDMIYVGAPSCEEHLHSKYLVFESNCDGGWTII